MYFYKSMQYTSGHSSLISFFHSTNDYPFSATQCEYTLDMECEFSQTLYGIMCYGVFTMYTCCSSGHFVVACGVCTFGSDIEVTSKKWSLKYLVGNQELTPKASAPDYHKIQPSATTLARCTVVLASCGPLLQNRAGMINNKDTLINNCYQ